MDAPRPMSTIPTSVPTLGECSEGIPPIESKGYHAQILHQGHPTLTHGAHHEGDQGHPEDRQKERDYKEILGGSSCELDKRALAAIPCSHLGITWLKNQEMGNSM